MAEAARTLTLIDGSSYIFRAYHAIRAELSTSSGLPTRAVFGFTRMLLKTLREAKPTHLAVVWDRDGKQTRQAIYAEYKTNRPPMPDDLKTQLPYIRKVTDVLAVPSVDKAGWEADDVIATLARTALAHGFDVVIVTGDKDFSQLVGPHVRLFDGMLDKWTGPAEVEAKWGIPAERFVDFQALLGDAIDNVPGVPGVGEKTAAELIRTYGSVEAVVEACAQGQVPKKKVTEAVCAAREQLQKNKELVRLRADLDVPVEPEQLARRTPDLKEVQALFRQLEFSGLLRELPAIFPEAANVEASGFRLQAPGTAPASPTAAAPSTPPATEEQAARYPTAEAFHIEAWELPPVELITTVDQLATLVRRAQAAERLGLKAAAPGEAVHGGAEPAGVALAVPGAPAAWVPFAHRGMFTGPQLPQPGVLAALRDAVAGKPWLGLATKRDMVLLAGAGVELPPPAGDAEIACYLLNPARKTFAESDLCHERLACELPEYGAVAGVGKERRLLADLDPATIGPWMARCAAAMTEAAIRLERELEREGLAPIYRELEIPLIPVLARMERDGVRLDSDRLRVLGREVDEQLALRLKECFETAGHEFNVASPKQLAVVLFEELKLPVLRRTKTGPSTDHEVLEKLAEQHPLPRAILEHRTLAKLKGTYIDTLPQLVGRDGRLHTTFDQVNAETGRLASNDPNLMNIPIRTDLGRRIREAFVADPGAKLLSADYSQIELRILAHFSQDPGLLEALRSGADVHRRTAAEVFGIAEDAVTSEQRRIAKMINYAVAYGLSAYGLSTRLDIPGEEAKQIIARYFERYAGVRAWIDRLLAEAKQTGRVQTLEGRRRFLPDLGSRIFAMRQAAERAAINMPIQGTAADIIKRAMIRVDERLRRERLGARLLLQVHDELVFEVPGAEVEAVTRLAREEMAGAARLAVPLVVDVGVGPTWADAH